MKVTSKNTCQSMPENIRMINTFAIAAIVAASVLASPLLIQQVLQQEASAHKDGDGDADLYVASFASSEILRYDGDNGEFIDEFVSSGSGGLESPIDLVFGPDGNLFVADAINEVLRFDGDTGEFIDVFVTEESGGLNDPESLVFAIDDDDNKKHDDNKKEHHDGDAKKKH